MNWQGSGFIPILIYSLAGGVLGQEDAILTENSLEILTESGSLILTEG